MFRTRKYAHLHTIIRYSKRKWYSHKPYWKRTGKYSWYASFSGSLSGGRLLEIEEIFKSIKEYQYERIIWPLRKA